MLEKALPLDLKKTLIDPSTSLSSKALADLAKDMEDFEAACTNVKETYPSSRRLNTVLEKCSESLKEIKETMTREFSSLKELGTHQSEQLQGKAKLL